MAGHHDSEVSLCTGVKIKMQAISGYHVLARMAVVMACVSRFPYMKSAEADHFVYDSQNRLVYAEQTGKVETIKYGPARTPVERCAATHSERIRCRRELFDLQPRNARVIGGRA